MTTEQVIREGFYWPYENYGVQFSAVGEDGEDLVAFGHPDTRRLIAAFNRYARVECGMTNLIDDPCSNADDVAAVAAELERTWAVFSMHCDDECDLGADCSACQQIQEDGGWIWWGRKEAEEGAFPVTVLRRWGE